MVLNGVAATSRGSACWYVQDRHGEPGTNDLAGARETRAPGKTARGNRVRDPGGCHVSWQSAPARAGNPHVERSIGPDCHAVSCTTAPAAGSVTHPIVLCS